MPSIRNGDTVGLVSNMFGWLHTFRNCISTLITFRKLPVSSVSLVLARLMKSSYRKRWRFDRRHITTCSYFCGICFSTSDFSRRSRNGRKTLVRNKQNTKLVSQHLSHQTINEGKLIFRWKWEILLHGTWRKNIREIVLCDILKLVFCILEFGLASLQMSDCHRKEAANRLKMRMMLIAPIRKLILAKKCFAHGRKLNALNHGSCSS